MDWKITIADLAREINTLKSALHLCNRAYNQLVTPTSLRTKTEDWIKKAEAYVADNS